MNSLAPVAHIQAEVALFYHIPRRKMTEYDQTREAARPRSIAMYLAKEITGRSNCELGCRFKRDHSTIRHAFLVVKARALADAKLAADIAILRERLGGER